MGVHFYSYTTHNMKTACFIVLALVAVSQAQLGGWNDMDCGKNSMCAKRFNKFMVPKISDHLAHDKCDWKFCHVERRILVSSYILASSILFSRSKIEILF